MLHVFTVGRTYPLDTRRKRLLTGWEIIPYTDDGADEWKVQGQVIEDSEPMPASGIRFTTSSPIQYRVGRTLITESGSQYHLDDIPAVGQDADGYEMFEDRKE